METKYKNWLFHIVISRSRPPGIHLQQSFYCFNLARLSVVISVLCLLLYCTQM